MKICILTERMRLGFGVDLVVDEQARRLAAAGHEVVVLVIHADLVQPPRNYELIVINRLMHLAEYDSESSMRRILRRAAVSDVDLWMLHTPPFYDWLQWLDGPVIVTEYGAPPGHFFKREVGRHIDSMVEQRLGRLYRQLQPFDAIVSISHSLHNWLPDYAQLASTVIHLGGDHFPKIARHEAENLRTSIGIQPHECMVLWVGRMQLTNDEQPYKGFPALLKLLPLAMKRLPQLKFVLAGRISASDERRLVNQGVQVLPNLNSYEIGRAFAAADILLNLSEWEGFNLALLEAQFQGTPVIAYEFGPHLEIVRDNQTGVLAKTPSDLFDAVINLASDDELRRRFSDKAAEFAQNFTWDKNVAQLCQVMENCVNLSPSRSEVSALREKARLVDQGSTHGVEALGSTRRLPTWRSVQPARWLIELISGLRQRLRQRPSPWFVLQDDAFVREAYRVLLGREAEPAAVEGWCERLRNGERRQDVLSQIRCSSEGQSRALRDPDLIRILSCEGEEYRESLPMCALRYLGRFRPTVPALPVSSWFLAEDETFVRQAYRILLGREPEQQEVQGWRTRLLEGDSRQSLLAEMRFSEEGKTRTITDPTLRRILAQEAHKSRRAGCTIPSDPAPREREPENTERQIRRIESRQRVLAAEVSRVGQLLERLGILEEQLKNFVEASPLVPGPPMSEPVEPRALLGVQAAELWPNHVLMVAPGVTIDPAAVSHLAQAIEAAGSDITFGDELECRREDNVEQLRIRGPFCHDAFLHSPEIGGVVVVHRTLLERLKLPPSTVLTGRIVLQLVASAHTVTYVPIALCKRQKDDIILNRPDINDLRTYLDRIQRNSIAVVDTQIETEERFDVRFPVENAWKALIVIVLNGPLADYRTSINELKTFLSDGTFQIILAGSGDSLCDADDHLGETPSLILLRFPPSTSYGRMVNEAIRQASHEYDVIVVMDGGVVPTHPEWLVRLAETALGSMGGVVAPMTVNRSGQILHAGIALDSNDLCKHISLSERALPVEARKKDLRAAQGLRLVSAVSRHCMAFRRKVFDEHDGFDENFSFETADIDFCLRLWSVGIPVRLDARVIMISGAEALNWKRSQPADEVLTFINRHQNWLMAHDRFWNPGIPISAAKNRIFPTIYLPPIGER